MTPETGPGTSTCAGTAGCGEATAWSGGVCSGGVCSDGVCSDGTSSRGAWACAACRSARAWRTAFDGKGGGLVDLVAKGVTTAEPFHGRVETDCRGGAEART